MVSIAAFQAVDLGSIPGRRTFCSCLFFVLKLTFTLVLIFKFSEDFEVVVVLFVFSCYD